MFVAGILQSSWKGSSTQTASDCESQVLQQTGRREDQAGWWSMCTRSIRTFKKTFHHQDGHHHS